MTYPEAITLRKMSDPWCWVKAYVALRQKCLEIPDLGYWESEHRFHYLKAATRELLDMTTTSAPSERVYSHADDLYNEKRANLGAGYESLLFTCLWEWIHIWAWTELGLETLWFVCKCNSNFNSIPGFRNSANFNSNLICESCVSSNFNFNLI